MVNKYGNYRIHLKYSDQFKFLPFLAKKKKIKIKKKKINKLKKKKKKINKIKKKKKKKKIINKLKKKNE